MSVKLIANYSKKLGLPGYSSHSFNIAVETELMTTDDIPAESARLYETLQAAVDAQMQATGFVPDAGYGMDNTNGTPANRAARPAPATSKRLTVLPGGQAPENGHAMPVNRTAAPSWKCSLKQREFINNLVAEHNLNRTEIDTLARERFGAPVVSLNKLQASGLIDELLQMTGSARSSGSGGHRNGGAR